MYVLIVKGPRRATLAYHTCETRSDLDELIAVYRALGYTDGDLIIEERHEKAAA